MANNTNSLQTNNKGKYIIITGIILAVIILALTSIMMKKDTSRSLEEAFESISAVQTELHKSVLDAGLNTEQAVQSSEPRECRSGLNKRDNTFQRRSFFTVKDVTDTSSSKLKELIVSSYDANNISTQVESESDIANRFRINGSRDNERYSVSFTYSDGGKTATISASTECLNQKS